MLYEKQKIDRQKFTEICKDVYGESFVEVDSEFYIDQNIILKNPEYNSIVEIEIEIIIK